VRRDDTGLNDCRGCFYVGNAGEDIAQISLRIDTVELGGLDGRVLLNLPQPISTDSWERTQSGTTEIELATGHRLRADALPVSHRSGETRRSGRHHINRFTVRGHISAADGKVGFINEYLAARGRGRQ
jgi:hypothetical protein